VKTDLKNAGAIWVDKEVVTDGQFISSRKPDDIPAFSKTLIGAVGRRVSRGERREGEIRKAS
jgi:protease I